MAFGDFDIHLLEQAEELISDGPPAAPELDRAASLVTRAFDSAVSHHRRDKKLSLARCKVLLDLIYQLKLTQESLDLAIVSPSSQKKKLVASAARRLPKAIDSAQDFLR